MQDIRTHVDVPDLLLVRSTRVDFKAAGLVALEGKFHATMAKGTRSPFLMPARHSRHQALHDGRTTLIKHLRPRTRTQTKRIAVLLRSLSVFLAVHRCKHALVDLISVHVMAALGPGDLQLVFECLRGALSQNTNIQKQAESALHALEARPGFCSCLAVGGLCV